MKIESDVKLGDASCTRITTMQPRPGKEIRYYRTILYIENARSLPVRAEQYAFPQRSGMEPALLEEYAFYRIENFPLLGTGKLDLRKVKEVAGKLASTTDGHG